MKKNKKKVLYTRLQFLEYLNALNEVKFSLINFQRTFRRFYKFSILSDDYFFLNSKIIKNNISIRIMPDNYFEVRYSWVSHVYNFPISTNKNLFQKLLKHNLI